FRAQRFRLSATTGTEITVSMSSTNFDAYLYLEEDDEIRAQNDDYLGLNSRIVYSVPYTSDYFIEATSRLPEQTGNFTLSVQCRAMPEIDVLANGTVLTNNSLVDFG